MRVGVLVGEGTGVVSIDGGCALDLDVVVVVLPFEIGGSTRWAGGAVGALEGWSMTIVGGAIVAIVVERSGALVV